MNASHLKGLHLESLEHRLLFATTLLNGGLIVDGTAGADSITLNTTGSQIDVNLNGVHSQFNFADIDTITINGQDLADTITDNVNRPTIVNGGTGDDTITTSGAGDTILWNSGDGSDVVDTGAGSDFLIVNGDSLSENYALSAVGNSLRLTRDIGSVVVGVHGVENVMLNPLGGADNVTVNSLVGTDVTAVTLDLSGGSGTGDGDSDTVIVNGPSNGSNTNVSDLTGGGTRIGGLGSTLTVRNADAGDMMRLNFRDAIDSVSVFQNGSAGGIRRLEVDGGGESDTINVQQTAADGVVVVEPSSGNDLLNANAANMGAANVLVSGSAKFSSVNVGSGGFIQLAPGGGNVLTTNFLNFSPNGKIDLVDNALIVDYSGFDPFASIQSQIFSGYNNGAWNAAGIISSTAASHANMGIGYAEASSVFTAFPAMFKGQVIDNTSILLAYTFSGDANLDGVVNSLDFTALAQQFNQAGQRWSQGDFNYSAKVNALDFGALATNFGQTASEPAFNTGEQFSLFSDQQVTESKLKRHPHPFDDVIDIAGVGIDGAPRSEV